MVDRFSIFVAQANDSFSNSLEKSWDRETWCRALQIESAVNLAAKMVDGVLFRCGNWLDSVV
jgi:hypothetical protein